MKQLGVFGLAIGEPYGEAAVPMPAYVLITEQLARGWMSPAGAMGGHTVVAKLLLAFGTEEQKQHYLPRMATGEVGATMRSRALVLSAAERVQTGATRPSSMSSATSALSRPDLRAGPAHQVRPHGSRRSER
jgi:alkylation response protein AidB-like acyl-CoA dehydrogenase